MYSLIAICASALRSSPPACWRSRIGVTFIIVLHPWTTCPGASFHPVGDLPGGPTRSAITGVSGDGSTAVGWSPSLPGRPSPIRWTEEGGMEAIGDVPSVFSWALAASYDGSVVTGGRNNVPFVWSDETGIQHFPSSGISHGNFFGTSADGSTAAGFYQFLDGSGEVVLWSGEEEVSELEIEGIARAVSANGNVVTGYAVISGRVQAFRWEKETGAVPLGDLQTENLEESRAFGISADGTTVVGFAATDSGARQAFRWTEADGMQDLTLGMVGAGPRSSWAYDVSADGSVVVGLMEDNVAVVWNEDDGMHRLDEWLIDELGLGDALEGWKLTIATGISDDGLTIVGEGINPRGNDEGWVVKLDPASLLGDLDHDGLIGLADLDTLCSGLSTGTSLASWDMSGDGIVDGQDVAQFLALTGRTFGDADFNGKVDFSDFLTLSENFGDPNATQWSDGNFDCTGHVEFSDFLTLSTNFATSTLNQTVPEADSQAVFLAWIVVLLYRRPSIRQQLSAPTRRKLASSTCAVGWSF